MATRETTPPRQKDGEHGYPETKRLGPRRDAAPGSRESGQCIRSDPDRLDRRPDEQREDDADREADPSLIWRGYRVATIKHHHHGDFEADQPGKDSWRHARA